MYPAAVITEQQKYLYDNVESYREHCDRVACAPKPITAVVKYPALPLIGSQEDRIAICRDCSERPAGCWKAVDYSCQKEYVRAERLSTKVGACPLGKHHQKPHQSSPEALQSPIEAKVGLEDPFPIKTVWDALNAAYAILIS